MLAAVLAKVIPMLKLAHDPQSHIESVHDADLHILSLVSESVHDADSHIRLNNAWF